ncbi:MAG: disulfide reductase, partial [Coriobacteriia bacterium]|nr:disulfide reductase [Coriobacteriia bacterium]
MSRIGVFICHCGTNISATVDVEKVGEAAAKLPNVVHVEINKYMCSDPSQDLVREVIKEHKLDRIVMGTCSPRMHELTWRK